MTAQLGQILVCSLGLVLLAVLCLAAGRRCRVHLSGLLSVFTRILRGKGATSHLPVECEARYRALFNGISEGFALHEIIVDKNGVPYDYRFLDVNPAFAAQTGVRREDWIGRTVREVLPDLEHGWVEIYGRVALTGEAVRFERYSKELGKHYRIVAFSPQQGQFAVLMIDITDLRRIEEEVSFKNALLSIQQEASLDGILAVGADGKVLFHNQRFADMLGIAPELFEAGVNMKLLRAAKDIVADPEAFKHRIRRLYEHSAATVRDELLLKDGRTLDRYATPMFGPDGRYYGRVWYLRDVTEQKLNESQIRLHSAALNAAHDLVIIMNARGTIVFANAAFERQTGYTPSELVGYELYRVWPETPSGTRVADMWESLHSGEGWTGEIVCKSKDGRSHTADVSITPLADEEGHPEHWVAIGRNVTDRKVQEGLLDYQAHHDSLTDLPNRILFSQELAATLADRRARQQQCAVLFVDLDRFKFVNDTMGHQAGDELLVDVALRLAGCLRAGDMLARIGGDEFIALLKNIKSPQDAGAVANRMLQQMVTPFDVHGSKLVIGASIGVAIFPDNATDVEDLIKCADAAMYRAKELGRNNKQFYSKELNESNQARAEMERDLRQAIHRDELKVFYQPIVDAQTMRLVGAEALLRWDHPEKGAISPGLFIPIAEETGLITEIGGTVLASACRQVRLWQEAGCGELQISVNVSAVQLRSRSFPEEVLSILSETGLAPASLNIEIVERMLDQNDHRETEKVAELREAGVNICLDDFGIGYSSLSRLKDLPIGAMKVDGSFIKDIGHNPKDRAMTESIISMAHSLGIKVTAEWIESEEQLATVRSFNCDYAQGYYISPALTPEAFADFAKGWCERGSKAA